MQGTCGEIVGLILLMNTVLATLTAIGAPFWIEEADSHSGLMLRCKDKCTWYFEDDFLEEKKLPDWFKATQGLMCAGLVFALTALVISIAALACACHSCNARRWISWIILLSCVSMIAGIVVFGVKAKDDWDIELKKGSKKWLGWSFWVEVGAAVLAFLATFLYCCMDKKQD